MFNQNIKQEIVIAKQEIEQEINKKNIKVEFIRKFLDENSFQGINSIENINVVDLFIAYFLYLCEDEEIVFEEIKSITYNNKAIFSEQDSSTYNSLFNLIEYVATVIDDDELDRFFNNNGKLTFDLRKLFRATEKYASIMTLVTFSKNNNCDIASLIKLAQRYSDKFSKSQHLISATIQLREIVEMYKGDLSIYRDILNIKISEKDSTKTIKENLKLNCDTSKYDKELLSLRNYCIGIINAEEARQRELRKQINAYRNVEIWMDKTQNKNTAKVGIISIDSSIIKIPSISIKLSILKDIYSHNVKLGQSLENKNNTLLENSANHYKKMLKKYNISIQEDEFVFDISVSEVEKILIVLKKLNITIPEIMLEILKTSDFETVNTLSTYVNKGFIDLEFLLANINLFDKDNPKFKNLNENILYLQEEKISAANINKMNSVLLEEPNCLKDNILTLKEYLLFKHYKKATSYEFLSSRTLADKIDIMLELDCESNLEEDLALLNYSIDNYKRLEVLRRLNISLESTEEIKNVLENKNFLIPDENLSDYILNLANYSSIDANNSITKKEFLEKLEQTKEITSTSRVYHFENLIISKNKIKREMDKLEKETLTSLEQFNCLVSNKSLTRDEYQTVKRIVSSSGKSDTPRMIK